MELKFRESWEWVHGCITSANRLHTSLVNGKVNIAGGTGLKHMWHILEAEVMDPKTVKITIIPKNQPYSDTDHKQLVCQLWNYLYKGYLGRVIYSPQQLHLLQSCSQWLQTIGLTSHLSEHQCRYYCPSYQKEWHRIWKNEIFMHMPCIINYVVIININARKEYAPVHTAYLSGRLVSHLKTAPGFSTPHLFCSVSASGAPTNTLE